MFKDGKKESRVCQMHAAYTTACKISRLMIICTATSSSEHYYCRIDQNKTSMRVVSTRDPQIIRIKSYV